LTSDIAAALLLQGMTAHYLCKTVFPLGAGHIALVHAAAGGVGLLLTQMAKRAGAQVIGTVSTEAKAALAKDAGADHVINYRVSDFASEVKRLTGGRGVDVAYDSVGKDTFDRSLDSLAPRGYLVLYGQSSGVVPAFDPGRLSKGSYSLTRPTLQHYTATRQELLSRSGDLFAMVAAGQLHVRIDRTFPLAQAADAHRALTGRETTGQGPPSPVASRRRISDEKSSSPMPCASARARHSRTVSKQRHGAVPTSGLRRGACPCACA
jgi:NADPH2:quinone reductase